MPPALSEATGLNRNQLITPPLHNRAVGKMFARSKLIWSPEKIAELRKMAEEGASLNRATIRLKRTRLAVRKKAKELGLKFKDPDGGSKSKDAEASV